MKSFFFKRALFLTVLASTCYFMQPQEVDAKWDFDSGTGTWTINYDNRTAFCKGSWWTSECEGTVGVVHF